eukprot:XP_014770705.1 PREDICTED: general transcription factor II-I repeat domain-containing protein 2B-like [Octopus bimaculoides]
MSKSSPMKLSTYFKNGSSKMSRKLLKRWVSQAGPAMMGLSLSLKNGCSKWIVVESLYCVWFAEEKMGVKCVCDNVMVKKFNAQQHYALHKENKYAKLEVALDESTNSTDSAQILYFIRGITDDFELYEELFALGTLKGRMQGIDIFNNFKEDFAFLCDVMSKQNELNILLEGKNKCTYDMWQKIWAFRKKLSFFKFLLAQSKLLVEHFPQLMKVMSENEDIYESFEEYESVLDSFIEEYNKRFNDFEKHNITLKLAFQPHLVDLSEAPEELQMELIEMSEDNILKSLFDKWENPIEIWENAVEYSHLCEHARQLISCFSLTYCCESTFLYLMQIKNLLRMQLTHEYLEDKLKLKTTMLESDIKMLSQKK